VRSLTKRGNVVGLLVVSRSHGKSPGIDGTIAKAFRQDRDEMASTVQNQQ
jgi:hypothetical protein